MNSFVTTRKCYFFKLSVATQSLVASSWLPSYCYSYCIIIVIVVAITISGISYFNLRQSGQFKKKLNIFKGDRCWWFLMEHFTKRMREGYLLTFHIIKKKTQVKYNSIHFGQLVHSQELILKSKNKAYECRLNGGWGNSDVIGLFGKEWWWEGGGIA